MGTLAHRRAPGVSDAGDERHTGAATVLDHLTALRLPEVTLMVGLFVIGSAFALDRVTPAALVSLAIYAAASWFFVLSVYSINAWGGYVDDLANPKFPSLRRVRPSFFLWTAAVGLVLFVSLYAVVDLRILGLALTSYVLWIFYSVPRVGLKLLPVPGAAIHVVSQVVHFQMGWLLFQSLSATSVLVSLYFAIVWTAGYLNHQIMDHPYDTQARVPTLAVSFGVRVVDIASAVAFSLGAAYWLALYLAGVLETWELWPFVGVWLGLALAKLAFTLFGDGTAADPFAYRFAYRLLVGVGCAVYVGIKFLG